MTAAAWAQVRRAYENGAPRSALLEDYGVTDRALSRHIAAEGWRRNPASQRRERLDALYGRALTRLEQAMDEGTDADKLAKLLSAAEKLDKLSPDPAGDAPAVIRVELGGAKDYAV